MFRRIRRERGSITIEATISLSAFMFAIITFLTIVNICIVQSKMSIAINSAAKELSQYSYLYAMTGLNKSEGILAESGAKTKEEINGVLSDVNTVFSEIQALGDNEVTSGDVSGLLNQLDNVSEAGATLKNDLEALASDPKQVAFGLLKVLGTDAINLAKSRLIAAPLSKAMCKKNLVAERGGDVESYLKSLGVQPHANGSYLDGLDFSKSTIFPSGSNEIRVNVSYDVKVIALLPIDFSFHFNQTAVTHGWLLGEDSYRTTKSVLDNDNIWTSGTVKERSELIRHQGIEDMKVDGYEQVTGASYQDIHMYNGQKKEFLAIHSMNPLYSAEGEKTKTLADINKDVIKNQIEYLCTGISDTVGGLNTIQTKVTGSDGSTTKNEYKCSGASKKIIIVIPEDKNLKEEMQKIIDSADKKGVTVVLQTGYGNGARTTESSSTEVKE